MLDEGAAGLKCESTIEFVVRTSSNLVGCNRMAWQWAETLVEIRGTLVDIRGTTN